MRLGMWACMLAGCLGQSALADAGASGWATVGGAPVSWGAVGDETARQLGVAPPLSLLMFAFTPGLATAPVSDAQWAAEAARQGTDVRTIRMILGDHVYVDAEGRVAACTMFAIQDGRCGEVAALSLDERVAAAQAILAQSGSCRWTGFDPALHERAASAAGAGFASLWVAADCR